MQERHRQARHLGLVRAVGRSRPGIYRGGFSALIGFWARAQAWLRHALSALPADARAHAARARIPLRSRCVRCLPMGRHHFALRSRFHMPEAPTTWLRACGMQDLHFYVRGRSATSPAQIILPLPGCSPTTARIVAWVRLCPFACALRQKEGPCGREARKARGGVAADIRAVRGITSLLTLVCSIEGPIFSG